MSNSQDNSSPNKIQQGVTLNSSIRDGSKVNSEPTPNANEAIEANNSVPEARKCATCQVECSAYYFITGNRKLDHPASSCVSCRAVVYLGQAEKDGYKPKNQLIRYLKNWQTSVEAQGGQVKNSQLLILFQDVQERYKSPMGLSKGEIVPNETTQSGTASNIACATNGNNASVRASYPDGPKDSFESGRHKATSASRIDSQSSSQASRSCSACDKVCPRYCFVRTNKRDPDPASRCIECRAPEHVQDSMRSHKQNSATLWDQELKQTINDWVDTWKVFAEKKENTQIPAELIKRLQTDVFKEIRATEVIICKRTRADSRDQQQLALDRSTPNHNSASNEAPLKKKKSQNKRNSENATKGSKVTTAPSKNVDEIDKTTGHQRSKEDAIRDLENIFKLESLLSKERFDTMVRPRLKEALDKLEKLSSFSKNLEESINRQFADHEAAM